MLSLTDLNEQLKTRSVNVVFTKVDGTTRTMICTKNLELVPSDKYPKQDVLPGRVLSEDVFRVFDIEKVDWRSFRKESVISWN